LRILDGRQPEELQLDDLLADFPLDWVGQINAWRSTYGKIAANR
jgi:hypothetical protein